MIEKQDFPLMIRALHAAGYTCYKIGLVCDVDANIVIGWRDRGVEPRYTQAVKLLELYRTVSILQDPSKPQCNYPRAVSG